MAYTQILLSLPTVPDFIGREAELQQLDTASLQTHLIVVTGPPGVGRTRLVQRWLDGAPQWTALAATALHSSASPGSMLGDLIMQWAMQFGGGETLDRFYTAIDALSAEFIGEPCSRDVLAAKPFLARLAGFAPTDERERNLSRMGVFGELISGLRAWMECLCRHATSQHKQFMLFLDDFDVADAATRELLDTALAGLSAEAMPLIVATMHFDEATGAGLKSIAMGRLNVEVKPFSPVQQNQFIGKMLRGYNLPQRLNETLWRQTGGNALAIEQQLRLLVTSAILQAGMTGQWSVADGVGSAGSTKALPALIADVMRGLPGPTLQAIVAAAGCGLRASRQHVSAVIRELGGDPAELDRHAVRLVRQGFLRPIVGNDGAWVFRHPMFVEAAPLVMPAVDQPQFHRGAMTALSPFASVAGGQLSNLVFNHAMLAKAYPEALAWGAQAARDAMRLGLAAGVIEVCERAIPLFSRVIDTPESAENKATIVMQLGRMLMNTGDLPRAAQAHSLLPSDDKLSPNVLKDVLIFRADLHALTGRYPDVFNQLEELLSQTDPHSVEYADIAVGLGNVIRRRGDFERGRECFATAREIYLKHNKLQLAINCMHLAAAVYRLDNRLDEAELLLDEALALTDKLGDRSELSRALVTLGILHGHRSELEAAESAFRRALGIAQAMGDFNRVDQSLTNLAACLRLRGKNEEARQIFREVLQRARIKGQLPRMAACLVNLSDLSLDEGDYDAAIDELNEARSRVEHSDNMFMYPEMLTRLVGAHVKARRLYEARSLVNHAKSETQARNLGDLEALCWAYEGEILSFDGGREIALQCFDKALRAYDDFVALGKTSEVCLRSDILLRYSTFLLLYERDLSDAKLVPEGPGVRAREFLQAAERELRDWVTRGVLARKRDLDRVMELLSGFQQ